MRDTVRISCHSCTQSLLPDSALPRRSLARLAKFPTFSVRPDRPLLGRQRSLAISFQGDRRYRFGCPVPRNFRWHFRPKPASGENWERPLETQNPNFRLGGGSAAETAARARCAAVASRPKKLSLAYFCNSRSSVPQYPTHCQKLRNSNTTVFIPRRPNLLQSSRLRTAHKQHSPRRRRTPDRRHRTLF